MGGAIGGGFTTAPMGQVNDKDRFGNITPFAEFNIYCDPESARSIFSLPALAKKTFLIPLDVTHFALATKDVQQKLLNGTTDGAVSAEGGKPSDLRKMFHDLLTFFSQTYDQVFGISEGPPLHDPLAVAIILDPSLSKFSYNPPGSQGDKEVWTIDVVTAGEHHPEHAEGAGTVEHKEEVSELGRTVLTPLKGEGARVPRGVDVEWFWGEILGAVGRAEVHLKTKEK